MTEPSPTPDQAAFSPATAWAAEGARVGIVTCLACGAAVFLSTTVDSLGLHVAWHQASS